MPGAEKRGAGRVVKMEKTRALSTMPYWVPSSIWREMFMNLKFDF